MPTSKHQKILLEQEQQKYHCRFCNKGFSTGRALGGHIRTHGMYNEPIHTRVEEDSSDGNRLLPSSHICKFFRDRFYSLKSLSKHCCRGCVGAREDDNNSNGLSPPSFPRARTPTPPYRVVTEEENLANCLVFLSSARANLVLRNTDAAKCSTSVSIRITDAGEFSTSGSKEFVDYVILPPPSPQPEEPPQASTQSPPTTPQLFECKTCQKVFTSHQALGGHRASHKKVKGSFVTRLENKPPKMAKYTTTEDERCNRFHQSNQAGPSTKNMALAIVPFVGTSSQLSLPKKKSKVHECSVCKRQFPSSQALGRHKRYHWSASSSCAAVVVAVDPLRVASTELQVGNSSTMGLNVIRPCPLVFKSTIFTLDLNMPARPMDELPQFTLWFDMPTTMYLEPEQENVRENVLNVNIEEAESREVGLTNLSDLININEREDGSKWLHIGFGSISDQETRADQP